MAGDRQEPGRYERQHNPLQAVMLNTWVAVLLLLVLGGVLSWRLWQTDWRNGALGVVGLVVALVIFGLFSRMQYRSLAKASSTSAGLIDSRDERLERMSLDLHAHEEMEEQVAKRTEELSRQKAFNELVLASIGEGLFGLDNHGNITLLNPAAEKIFGMPAADLIGKNLYTLAAEANTEETDPDWQENPLILAWKSGQAMRGVESVHKRPDGTTVPIETSTYPLWDHGELLGAVMTVQDITERKRAEEQHRLFELLVRNVTDYAILILDPEGHVKTWNKGAERVKGYKAEEIIGQSYTRFYPPDQLEHAHELLRIAAEKGHVEDEGWRLRKDGTRFWADVVFTAMHDEQGNLVGFAKITRDLTEKREAERAARLELERQAAQEQAERLHKLNVELAEVTARAQEANRLKSEFLANMSHELRTPLNSIIGYTELVLYNKKQPPTERQAKNLSVVLRNGKHLLGLINDILDISKVEAGKATLYPEVIDLRQLLQSVVSATAPLANEKGLKVSVEVDPILDTIISDETKLRQIVLNLISNALKFTREGGVTVTASPEGQNRLAIAVKDTGVGIAPENQELVFEEFRQIDSSTTREAGGTGLGLAISRKLARLLGGDLHLTSTPGVGSTFTLTLPRKVSPEQPHAEAAPPEPALRVTPFVAEGKLPVVVIDDDPEMLHLIAERLKDSPYEAVPASSGESGLQLARELHPYAITLDVMMPRMDGWMVLRELKRDRATSDIPVLILSFVENKVLGFSLGASAYLSKPIDQGELLDTLDRLGHPLRAGEGYVLVVDDDPDARGLYKQILEKENVRVVEAVDGRQAIEAIDREPPALVLLDLMMPHMDGFDVVSWIRNHGKTHDVPVIVVTAKELTPEDYQKLAEVRHVITKGETAERLVIEDLRDLLDHSHPRPPAEAPAEERKPTP